MSALKENDLNAVLSHITDENCIGNTCAKPKCIKISIDD